LLVAFAFSEKMKLNEKISTKQADWNEKNLFRKKNKKGSYFINHVSKKFIQVTTCSILHLT